MKTSLPFILSIVFFSCGTNKAVYRSPDFTEKASFHRTIAILPFRITQTGYTAENSKADDLKDANEKWGFVFQESLHTYILKQTGKNKKGIVVTFQAPQKTNALLRQNNVTVEDIYSRSPEDIAKLLQADAVLLTTLEKDKNFSDGVAYGIAAGRIVLNAISKTPASLPWVNSSDINMNSYLYNSHNGQLLWKTYRSGGTDLPANIDGLVNYYSNWIAKVTV